MQRRYYNTSISKSTVSINVSINNFCVKLERSARTFHSWIEAQSRLSQRCARAVC
jgi:hypothetical protein